MRPWRLVALLSATATASYLCRVNVSVAGVLMMRELGLSQQAMGRVFSAFLVGYAVCQIPGGMLADRFGAARVLGWAALAWVAATGWIAGAGASVAALLAARCALGVAEAPTFPAAAQAIFAGAGGGEARARQRHGGGGHRPWVGDCAAAGFVSDGALGMEGGTDGVFSARAGGGLRVDVDWPAGVGAGRGCPRRGAIERAALLEFRSAHAELHAAGLRGLHLRVLVLSIPGGCAPLRPVARRAVRQLAMAALDGLDSARRLVVRPGSLRPARDSDGRSGRLGRAHRRRRAYGERAPGGGMPGAGHGAGS